MKWIAKTQAQIAAWLNAQPFWKPTVDVCTKICSPVVKLARGTLESVPSLRKVEWLLEIEGLTKRHPVALAFSMTFVAYRGIRTTPLGHIGTDPVIYPFDRADLWI